MSRALGMDLRGQIAGVAPHSASRRFPPLTGSSALAVAGSTLLVAPVQPLRRLSPRDWSAAVSLEGRGAKTLDSAEVSTATSVGLARVARTIAFATPGLSGRSQARQGLRRLEPGLPGWRRLLSRSPLLQEVRPFDD